MRKLYATCPYCEHQYLVRFWKRFFAPNMHSFWIHILHPSCCSFSWRWLRCPACKKHSWAPLENELIIEGRRLMNEFLQSTNESLKTLTGYLVEHRDEVVEEFNKKSIDSQ
jgi:hypothetical protein